MGLTDLLPPPRFSPSSSTSSSASALQPASAPSPSPSSSSSSVAAVPEYGSEARRKPRELTDADFGDGGAFPECHVLQFPLGMGRRSVEGRLTALAHPAVGPSGAISLAAVVVQQHRKDTVVYTELSDLAPKVISQQELEKPQGPEVAEKIEETRKALQKLADAKLAVGKPRNHVEQAIGTSAGQPEFVRYTPADAQSQEKVIKIQEAQVDPLEPPRFKVKKAPQRPPSPPVPVLHSPPRKVTKEDQALFAIPPCVSAWKNSKGYTIPIDKRTAADSRNLNDVEVNEKFAQLSEALYVAERNARKALEEKAQLRKKIALKQKETKEEELRELARMARERRAGMRPDEAENPDLQSRLGFAAENTFTDDSSESEIDEVDVEAKEDRDRIRKELQRERRRELRMENKGTKRAKRERELDRDISERIALGQGPPLSAGVSRGDSLFDQRLFNQQQGLGTGFASDDTYNIYSKPLFSGSSTAAKIYRPSADIDSDVYGGGDEDVEKLLEKASGRFKSSKSFIGAEDGDRTVVPETTAARSGPVQFEQEIKDPFGLEKFLSEAKQGGKQVLEGIGKQGMMAAAGGAASISSDSLQSGRRRMEFEESTSSSKFRLSSSGTGGLIPADEFRQESSKDSRDVRRDQRSRSREYSRSRTSRNREYSRSRRSESREFSRSRRSSSREYSRSRRSSSREYSRSRRSRSREFSRTRRSRSRSRERSSNDIRRSRRRY